MGYSPVMWGRQAWHFIHFVALSYPHKPTEEDKTKYKIFLDSLGNTLPCQICAAHFKENMMKHPPKMDSNEEFFNWTVDIHNLVNKANGKKQISFQKALEETQKNSKQNPQFGDIAKSILLSASLISLLVLFSYAVTKKK